MNDNVSERDRLRADIAGILYDQYTLTDGRKVKGQSFSFVQSHLRSKRWRPVTYCALMQSLDLCGFEVKRGRGRRVYHGGKMGLGVECDVVVSKQG